VPGHATAWTDAAAAAASAADADESVAGDNDAAMFAGLSTCRLRLLYVPFINSFATSDRRYVRLRDGRV